jgi:hypothetical protein
VRLKYSQDVYPDGLPNIKALVKGKKVADPRYGSPTVSAWSDNWALCVYDYLASSYGLGCGGTELDDASAIVAANASDEQVALDTASPTLSSQARYTCNGTIDLADRPVDILTALCTAGAGAVSFVQGTWKIFAGSYVTPVVEMDESFLRGAPELQPRPSRRELFNAVRGTIADESKSYQPTDFPPQTNATYEAQDGGVQIPRDIELPYTTNNTRAQRIGKIHLEKSRQGAVVTMPCNYKAFQVAVWDTVYLTIDVLGYDRKVFQVIGWKFSPNGGIDVQLAEEASSCYDWNAGMATTVDSAPDTVLPNPFSNLTLTLGTPVSGTAELFVAGDGTVVPRIRLPFTQPANPFIKEYEAQFARSAGSPQSWQDAPKTQYGQTSAFYYPVEDGFAYDMRLRAVTTIGNRGDWAYSYGHTVVGKTAVPSDVTGASAVQTGGIVVMGCNTVDDADLDSVEVRQQDYGLTDWTSATPIANILRGQTVTSAAIQPGTWELLFKAKDTSGNYSANAARVTLMVTSDGYTAVTSKEQSPDWLGECVHFVRHWTGKLVPDSQTLASAMTDAQLWDTFVYNPYTDSYYTAPVQDKTIDANARVYANVVTVLGPSETLAISEPQLQIDYRLAAGSFDGFENWSIGTVNFRYLQERLHLTLDGSGGVPVITGFLPTIDALSKTVSGSLTVGGSGTATATFSTLFHGTPVLQVTPVGTGDVTASYANLSGTGFDGYFRTAGVLGAGTISYSAQGA